MTKFQRFCNIFKDNQLTQWVAGILTFIAIIASVIAGAGFLSIVLLAILVALVIYFGSIKELAASIVVGSLFKMYISEIKTLLGYWTDSLALKKTLDYIANNNGVLIIILIFIFVYTVSVLTGSVKLLNVNVSNKYEAKSDDSGGVKITKK